MEGKTSTKSNNNNNLKKRGIIMMINRNKVKSIIKNIENTSMLCASNARYFEEGNDFIIRFEDGNNFTISLYITEFETQYGYILEDGTYKWYGTAKNEAFKNFSDFMFFIGCKLYEIRNHIENYVCV